MNALRRPGCFDNLGHGHTIDTAGGNSYGHLTRLQRVLVLCVRLINAEKRVPARLNGLKSCVNLPAPWSRSR